MPRIRGVALIAENPVGEILVLQEFVDKPHVGKRAGMFSIPMETSEPGESPLETLERLAREEAPGLSSLDLPGVYIGAYRIVPGVWVRLYRARAHAHGLPITAPGPREVGNYGWLSAKDALLLWLRQGAREMIEDHVSRRVGVVRRVCSAPPALSR